MKDTDSDLIGDYDEIMVYGTSGTLADSDFDLLNDYEEIFQYGTDPLNEDSDMDSISDYDEVVTYGSDPLSVDGDLDGLSDYLEIFTHHTQPRNNDSDGDLISDGMEINVYGTSPLLADTDQDLVDDYTEIFVLGSDPNNQDSDSDGLLDGVDFMPTMHWIVPMIGIGVVIFIAAVGVKRFRETYMVEEFVTTADPASLGLEPGMDIVVEYKIREGRVIFGVVVRNGSKNPMQNVQVILGVPDLTDDIKTENLGTVEPDTVSVAQIQFELQPGAEGELVGMIEYDSVEGEHRIVNLKPVKIVA
ncbi:MAG: hypothetical protein E3J86_08675 [Candidatus Thorarchaeota archaeon]|nr:MAG: hypothetical protein E3J86_08675 [Candidatus Thorarchaeota archaeon]